MKGVPKSTVLDTSPTLKHRPNLRPAVAICAFMLGPRGRRRWVRVFLGGRIL